MQDNEIGILYDTIYVGILTFRQDTIAESENARFGDNANRFEAFTELQQRLPVFPDTLLPFFSASRGQTCVLSSYMTEWVCKNQAPCIADFLDGLDTDFRQSVLSYYFPGDTDVKCVSEALENADNGVIFRKVRTLGELSINEQFSLCNILLDFPAIIVLLKATLSDALDVIRQYHVEHRDEIDSVIKSTMKKENARLLAGYCPQCSQVYVSLLSTHILMVTMPNECSCRMLCGKDFRETLLDMETNIQPVSAKEFIIAWGSEIDMQIFELLKANDEMTTTELAKEIGYSVTTLIRHLDSLLSANAIKINRRDGLKVYMALNPAYMSKARVSLLELLRDF